MHPLHIVESYLIIARANYHHMNTEKMAEESDLLEAEQILIKVLNQTDDDLITKIALGLLQRRLKNTH